MKNISKKSKIVVLFIFLTFIFYFGIIPRAINAEKYQSQIKKNIETSMDNPIKLGQMNSELTWDLGFKINLDKVAIYHKDGSDFVSSGPLSFEISLPYLLKNKYKIREIGIEKPVFLIKRLKNGHFDIEELFSNRNRVVFDRSKISASDYKIFLTDEFLPQNKSFFISGKKLEISDFNPDKFIKIDADGQIWATNRSNTTFNFKYSTNLPLNKKQLLKNNIDLKGKVENLYLDMYLPYLQRYLPDYSSLSGVINSDFDINLHQKDFWNDDLKFNIKVRDFTAQKQNEGTVLKALGLLKIDVFAKIKNGKLILEKATAKSPDVDIKLNGEIDNFDSKNPILNLDLVVKNSKLEAISYLFPDEIKVPHNIFEFLRKFKVKSNTSGSVDIKGKGKKLNLFGDLKFTGFSVARNSKTISDGIVKVHFDGKINDIDADIWAKPNEHLYIKGRLTPQLSKISLSVKAHDLQIAPAQELLFAIRDIMKFNLGHFVSNTNIEGKCDSDIYVYGDCQKYLGSFEWFDKLSKREKDFFLK